jgi:hypothetical protein
MLAASHRHGLASEACGERCERLAVLDSVRPAFHFLELAGTAPPSKLGYARKYYTNLLESTAAYHLLYLSYVTEQH